MILLSIIQGFKKSISHGEGSGVIGTHVVKSKSSSGKSVLHMVHDLSLDGGLVVTKVRTHQLPKFVGSLLRLVVLISELRL